MKILILLVVVFCGTIGVGINLLTSNTDRLAVEDSSATEQTDQTVVTYRPIPSSTYRIEGNPVQYNKKFQIQRFIELAKQLKLTNSMNTDLDHPRIQLRLKAMLDRADNASVLSLLKESNPAIKGNSGAIDLLYRRLAEINPEQATEEWLEQARTDSNLSAQGLLLSLVGRSVGDAEAWVNSVEQNHPGRERIVNSFASLVAKQDLAKAFVYLSETKAPMYSVIAQIPAAQIEGYAEMMKDEPDFLREIVDRWQQIDPEAAFNWILAQDFDKNYSESFESALMGLGKKQPLLVADRLSGLSSRNETVKRAASKFWLQWFNSGLENQAAIEWLSKNGDQLSLDSTWYREYKKSPQSIAERLDRLGTINELPDSVMKTHIMMSEIGAVAKKQPLEALEFMQEHFPTSSDVEREMSDIVEDWSKDGNAASATRWAIDNLPDNFWRNYSVLTTVSNWASDDPVAAAEYALSMPKSVSNDSLAKIAPIFAGQDPDSAIQFIRSNDAKTVSGFTQNAFSKLAETRDRNELIQLVGGLPTPESQQNAMQGVFKELTNQNAQSSDAYLRKLEPGTMRDAGIKGYIKSAIRENPESAARLSTLIQDSRSQRAKILKSFHQWNRIDSDAAKAWIQTTELPEPVLARLLKRNK